MYSSYPIDLFFIVQDTGRTCVYQPLCTIDTKHNLILLRIADGMIKLIDLKDLTFVNLVTNNIR
jgi:hypothetical protein